MSVYIKGMEMPKSGAYFCELGVLDESTAVLTIFDTFDEPRRSYKLVPVPPHGRLGDLDALEAKCTDEKGSYFSYEAAIIGEVVQSALTIIPADPPKEEE